MRFRRRLVVCATGKTAKSRLGLSWRRHAATNQLSVMAGWCETSGLRARWPPLADRRHNRDRHFTRGRQAADVHPIINRGENSESRRDHSFVRSLGLKPRMKLRQRSRGYRSQMMQRIRADRKAVEPAPRRTEEKEIQS